MKFWYLGFEWFVVGRFSKNFQLLILYSPKTQSSPFGFNEQILMFFREFRFGTEVHEKLIRVCFVGSSFRKYEFVKYFDETKRELSRR